LVYGRRNVLFLRENKMKRLLVLAMALGLLLVGCATQIKTVGKVYTGKIAMANEACGTVFGVSVSCTHSPSGAGQMVGNGGC
jgi:outer membrane lipoprotein SlyB